MNEYAVGYLYSEPTVCSALTAFHLLNDLSSLFASMCGKLWASTGLSRIPFPLDEEIEAFAHIYPVRK